ncbi:MAG: GAF domain-containing protein, partial [Acidobacteria bacterium]|nr:GAF domain-containing protein [Acidobacteriota bacterium]
MEASPGIYPELITAAANCRRARDFSSVLRRFTEFAEADGCIVWEKFYAGTAERRYFMLADYFPSPEADAPVWYFLPEKSVTGEAITLQEFRLVSDLDQAILDGRVPGGDLLKRRGITSFCAIPITFGPRREASLNLYWTNRNPPSEERLVAIQQVGSILPALHNSLLNQIGFALLALVERNLYQSKPTANAEESEAILQQVAGSVADAFNARECTIFLEDRSEAPGVYSRRATVWPWKTFAVPDFYTGASPGLTPWVIRKNHLLRFVDLAQFGEERSAAALSGAKLSDADYADLNWPSGPEPIAEFSASSENFAKPLSFLAVPIRDGDRVVGAIRCCLISSAPYHFDERHIQILELVAERIGHWWGARSALRAEKAETNRFRQLVTGIAAMQDIANRSLTDREKPQMDSLWRRSLELLAEVSPWKDALSIRIVQGDHLVYVANVGARWGRESSRLAHKLATTYPLKENWAGTKAIAERRVLTETDPGRPNGLRSHLFPDARRLIHAPIFSGDKAIGVIDIRGFDEREIPPHLALTCELIGRQLGLYRNLQETFWNLKTREAELFKQKEQQNQIYEDFVHQLRNPLVKAGMLAEGLGDLDIPELRQVRTHLRHANLFADTINYFVSLAQTSSVETALEVMRYEEIVPLLAEMARDQQ